MKKAFEKIGLTIDRIGQVGAMASLGLMIGLSFFGMILRWSGSSMMWIDPLCRHLVLVSAFAGAVLAVGKKNHIRIDVLTKPLEMAPIRVRWATELVATLGAFVGTVLLAASSWWFFQSEREYGGEGLFGFHSSVLVAILPAGLGLLSLRWLVFFLVALMTPPARD